MYNMNPYPQEARLLRPSISAALPYLRRVYALFSGGIAFAIAGALVALYAGQPTMVRAQDGVVALPPLVAFGVQHWFMMLALYLVAFFGASFVRRTPGLNVVTLFRYTFVTGLFLAPTLFFTQLLAS